MTQPSPQEDPPSSEPSQRPALPYATHYTGRGEGGGLVPLLSGFGLLCLGLLTLVFGTAGESDGGRGSRHDIHSLVVLILTTTSIALIVAGVIVIFRALRKYDW
jgi:hypothetical protein